MQKVYNIWNTSIEIFDNFIEDNEVYEQLKKESFIKETEKIQIIKTLTSAQEKLFQLVNVSVINYCEKNNINFNNLFINNIYKGCLYQYDEHQVNTHLYEPHHDMVENSLITVLYYIDSSYTAKNWCGGELTLYKHLTFGDYPSNCINVLPKQNRLLIFPGFNIHRVKPYFGKKPRTSLLFGYGVKDQPKSVPLTV
jgi:hypothetical protein